MQFEPEEWTDIYHSVRVGGGGSLGIRISMAGSLAHPAITRKYKWGATGESAEPQDVSDLIAKVSMAARDIENDIQRISFVRDPEEIEARANMKARIIASFPSGAIYVEEIPDEYAPGSYYTAMTPWFMVTTHRGRIKVGWRKRVINVDWSDSEIKTCGEELFPDEDVTKSRKFDGCYVHAWGYDKLAEYLKVILSAP
jgi:hypothetical protein